MKTKLDIQSVAVKQLESAIWMYAYDYDEVAVHTVAGAAFELYTTRLANKSFMDEMKETLNSADYQKFIKLWNKPYNFFKHGSSSHREIEELTYDEFLVEPLIYMACIANLEGLKKFRLNSANVYKTHFHVKHANLFKTPEHLEKINKVEALGISNEKLASKETLQVWLNSVGHTFINSEDSLLGDIEAQ